MWRGVDQSDRRVPVNLRQSGRAAVEMLISTRVRKSPFWHLAVEAGCWRATVYNRMYHPRGYVRPADGGAAAEHRALTERVTLWDVAVERQIRVAGPDAAAFVNFVVTRDIAGLEPMRGRYCILCNEKGGILNDPVLLRLAGDEFWFSISDSDLMLWLQGVNVGRRFDVEIEEIDVAPMQIQGPRSEALMRDLFGPAVCDLAYYGLMEASLADRPVIVSRTGFSGEKGFEVYVRDATSAGEDVWRAVLAAGEPHELAVIAPGHQRRIAAGILSWGQDMDAETSPFQVKLDWQVPRDKQADYVGRASLERQRRAIEEGRAPFVHQLVGLKTGGRPIEDYAADFWLVLEPATRHPVGWITSPWWSPELATNIVLAYVPWDASEVGRRFLAALPEPYADGPVEAEVVDVPFRPSTTPGTRERRKADRRSRSR